MGKDPAVLFYTSDFLSATQGLTMAEIGQLIKLICVQHQTGHLTKKAIKLSVGTVSRDVIKFFELDENGLYYNKRLDDEVIRRAKYSESRQRNAKKRYENKNTYADASAMHIETETKTETKTETEIKTVNEAENSIKKNKYGELENVELTEKQYEQLKEKFPKSYKKCIDDLSYYIASKGDKYKSHYAVILSWNRGKSDDMSSFDTDEFFEAAVKRSAENIRRRAREHEAENEVIVTDSKGNAW